MLPDSLVLDAAHFPFGIRIDMLASWAPCIAAVPGSGIRDSFVFRLFSFLRPLIILRAFLIVLTASVGVSARTSGCACRSRISLRTCWSGWSGHGGCCWSSLAPSDKER
jgi:hypothetical protein